MIDVDLKTKCPIRIKKWKLKEGMPIAARQLIMLYEEINSPGDAQNSVLKYKSTNVGTVKKICAAEGSVVKPGQLLLQLEECTHPTVMKDMCAECGADLRQTETVKVHASVPMVHSIPELKVSEELAQTLGKADEARLLKDKKLVLLVDLDQTLIHTTNDNIPPNLKDVVHFQLFGPQSQWYHTRIRPGTEKFLESVSNLFELHICTFGARNYAHFIAMFLDPDGRLFSHRILSRDECFDANSKTANLRALFPCGDSMVCIIDDREDVWNYAPNLIHVKPYHFFQHTGDINAPPGLTKKENDTVEDGFDFSKLGQKVVEETEIDKKSGNSIGNKKKSDRSGETTTDKDTEDEKDVKPNKISSFRKSETNDNEKKEVETESVTNKIANSGISESSEGEKIEKNKNEIVIPNQKSSTDNNLQTTNVEEKIEKNSKCENTNDLSHSEKTDTCSVEEPKILDKNDEIKKSGSTDVAKVHPENVVVAEAFKHEKIDGIQCESGRGDEEQYSVLVDDTLADEEDIIGKAIEIAVARSLSPIPIKEHKPKMVTTDKSGEEMIEVEDTDDYLMHLEDILKKVHAAYYDIFDKLEDKTGPLPDLKVVIPEVKRKVLEGCNLVFSGLVPSHVPLNRSRAYAVAKSLGATVTTEVSADTTHLVAARAGTVKVNSSRRQKGVHIVTPHWLWHCAERWERVDERLYPLARGVVTNRHPPAHCGSPQHPGELAESSARARTASGRFSDTINPLLTFSREEMARMDQEVEDLCADDDDSESEAEIAIRPPVLPIVDPDSSSCDSLTGWEGGSLNPKKRKMETTTCTESDLEEDSPCAKFRRGEPLPSDLDLGEDSQDDTQDSQDIDGDDSTWTLMGAALEREFLSGD